MTAAIRNFDFISSIGVNVHVEYTDGQYANSAAVISDLSYLGINHVRDATLNPENQGQASYGQLANAGIKFDMLFLGTSIPSSVSLLDAFVAAHPGSVSAIEGLNEINNWPITFGGLTGNAAALAYQSSLYSTVKADPSLGGVPVYNLTNDTNIGGVSDYSNVHAYPWSGQQPYQTLLGALQTTAMPGEGAVLTEAGYYTMTNGVGWGGVDQVTQAKLSLNLLMDATKLGFKETYLYQLLDAYADPTNSNPDSHFGRFDINNAPKPVATALHNITSILQDSAGGAATFQVGSLNYQVTGMPATGSSLLLEKSNGAYDIVLWNEPTVWNATTNTEVAAANVSVTVNLGSAFAPAQVFDPLSASGVAPISTSQNVSQLQVQLSDHPIVIEVSGSVPAVTAPTLTYFMPRPQAVS